MSFIEELKRRNVVRVSLGYAVAGWLLIEGMDVLTGTFDAPDWVMKILISLVLLGFFPVAVFSWVFEITPQGIKRESRDNLEHIPGSERKLDLAIIAMLAVAIGLGIYQSFSGGGAVNQPEPTQQTPSRAGPPMLAVLPFIATGLDGDSEFFASGMHDDLLTQLAQLQSLRVISRTSVLEYRDTVMNIRDIGHALGADAILEGRVQFAGGQIRINAQLIDARTDEHLWAQTFDRALTTAKVFEVQTEIARAITKALQTTLTVQDATQLTVMPTQNMAAYRAYHRALAIRDAPVPFDTNAFQSELEEAVSLDPNFTRAWAELAGIFSFANLSDENPDLIGRAEQALERIREQAPDSADYLIAQSYYTYYVLKNNDQAYQLILQAQDKAPSDVRLLELKSWIQRRRADLPGMIDTIRHARTLDPRNPRWTRSIVANQFALHRYDEAREEIESAIVTNYEIAYFSLLLEFKNHQDRARLLADMKALHDEFGDEADPGDLWEAYMLNRDYEAALEFAHSMATDLSGSASKGLSEPERNQFISYLFLQRTDPSSGQVIKDNYPWEQDASLTSFLDTALVAAARGDLPGVSRNLGRWRREASQDFAEFAFARHRMCRILGIAGELDDTVACIRRGLAEPSYSTMPFFETLLPDYDLIRQEPAFKDLLIETGYPEHARLSTE